MKKPKIFVMSLSKGIPELFNNFEEEDRENVLVISGTAFYKRAELLEMTKTYRQMNGWTDQHIEYVMQLYDNHKIVRPRTIFKYMYFPNYKGKKNIYCGIRDLVANTKFPIWFFGVIYGMR